MDQPSDHHRAVKEDGYTILRQALSGADVERLRSAVEGYLERPNVARYVFGGRVKSNPFSFEPVELALILGRPELAIALKSIAGGPVRFGREVGIAENLKSGWHKDMRGLDSETDDARGEPGVFKVLFYLQDHLGSDDDDFALRVRRGSHLCEDTETGPEQALFTRAGDAIVMDCRLTHRGQDSASAGLLTRAAVEGIRRFAGLRREFRVRQRLRRLAGKPDRQLITVLYGRCNYWTDAFMRNSRETERRRDGSLAVDPELPPSWRDALRSVEIMC